MSLIIFKMKNVSDTSCRKNENIFYIKYITSENCDFYEIITKNRQNHVGNNILWERSKFQLRGT